MFGTRIRYNAPDPFAAYDYRKFIHEVIRVGQPSKVACLAPNIPVKTGALARLSYYSQRLNPLAARIFKENTPNFNNPFHGNLAQAVELIHYLEETIRLLDTVQGDDIERVVVDRKKVRKKALAGNTHWPKRGVSAIESPKRSFVPRGVY